VAKVHMCNLIPSTQRTNQFYRPLLFLLLFVLEAYEYSLARKTCGPKRQDVEGACGKLHYELKFEVKRRR
jgi:hypothetical protein